MFKNQFGNNLLYLLSEKKSVLWSQFFQYVEYLDRQRSCEKNKDSIFNNKDKRKRYYSFLRDLSSLGYLDFGEKNIGKTIVQIAPPMLVELPFIRLTFLLTGARSPGLLQRIKGNSKIEVEKTTNKYPLPDKIILKPENTKVLEDWLEETAFQGDPLSSYIKIYKNPVAWSILKFSGNLKSYEDNLESHWSSSDKSNIQKIFDVDELYFKKVHQKGSSKNNLSLVITSHHYGPSKYYLFNWANEKRVIVNPDWGRFLVAKKSGKSVLEYNSRTCELISFLRLPSILERGLTLLSGSPPTESDLFSERQQKKDFSKKIFIFKNISCRIACLVADKLEQELKEYHTRGI